MFPFSPTLPSILGGRALVCDDDNDVDVDIDVETDLLFVGWNCEAAETAEPCDAVLNRTTRFLTGLASLLAWLCAGEGCRAGGCALLARVCRFSSPIEAAAAPRTLRRLTGFCSSGWETGDEGRWL